MDGESYHTLNPYALDLLPYAELKTIGKSLNLMGSSRGRISRAVLLQRIIEFHRQRDSDGNTLIDTTGNEENIPMNVTGNNFAVFPVIVNPNPSVDSKVKEKRKSKYPKLDSDGAAKGIVVKADVSMLSALQVGDISCTPSKGILKTCCDSPTSVEKTDFIGANKLNNKSTPGKLEKITFSPFNAVKVIPHRIQLSETKKEIQSTSIVNTRKRILFREIDEEEEEEDDDYYDAATDMEDDIDPDEEIDIYSDDETNDLVWNNTQRNSAQSNPIGATTVAMANATAANNSPSARNSPSTRNSNNNNKTESSTKSEKNSNSHSWFDYGNNNNNSDSVYLRSHEFFEL